MNNYLIGNQPERLLFFKAIVQVSQTDTRATTTHLHTKLSSLDEYMAVVDNNVKTSNNDMKGWEQSLLA